MTAPGPARDLAWFEKAYGDPFVGKERLRAVPLDLLRAVLIVPADAGDPALAAAGGYGVRRSDADRLQPFVDHTIDPARFAYAVVPAP